MTVREADLPGVGKKFMVDIEPDEELIIVIHNTGKREVYLNDDPEKDNKKLFELSDKDARVIGTILEGAYFQPIKTGSVETMLEGDAIIEWVKVSEGSGISGSTLDEMDIRARTGASVIAIQREGESITSITPNTQIKEGDILVLIASKESFQDFLDEYDI